MAFEPYTRSYFIVPKNDAEKANALGGIKVTAEQKAKNRFIEKVHVAADKDLWFFVGMNIPKETTWPFVTFEVVPSSDELADEREYESKNAANLIDDAFDNGKQVQDYYSNLVPNLHTRKVN